MNGLGRKTLVLAATMLVGGMPLTTGAAVADVDPVCGQTITSDTTLTADLGPCSNNGLVVGANNITLDLGGYRISGVVGVRGDGAGVLLPNRSGVTVRNGSITAFDGGVAIVNGGGNTVTGVDAFGNLGGSGAGTSGVRYGDGIAIESSSNNRVIANKTSRNGPFSGIGIYSLIDSDHPRAVGGNSVGNLVDSNDVLENTSPRPGGGPTSTDNDGIRMENFGFDNVISNNRVHGSGLDGIAIFADSGRNVIRGNTVTGNGFFRVAARRGSGVVLNNRANFNVVENNLITGNADNGIFVRGPFGAVTVGSVNNTIRYNRAAGNVVLPSIPSVAFGPAFDLNDFNPNCDNNTWFVNVYRTASQPCATTGGVQV